MGAGTQRGPRSTGKQNRNTFGLPSDGSFGVPPKATSPADAVSRNKSGYDMDFSKPTAKVSGQAQTSHFPGNGAFGKTLRASTSTAVAAKGSGHDLTEAKRAGHTGFGLIPGVHPPKTLAAGKQINRGGVRGSGRK